MTNRPLCIVSDCTNPATHRKRCSRHYSALRRLDPSYLRAERNRKLLSRYGISADQADELMASQEWCCAICSTPAEETPSGLVIDHDHATGAVRGAICPACNFAIGWVADHPELLAALVAYLDAHATLRLDPH